MSLKRANYKDDIGIWHAVLIPESDTNEDAAKGVPIGPPDLSELELPEEIMVRLSNELYNRDILTSQDVVKKRAEVASAIQATLKLDADRIVTLYLGKDYRYAREQPPENKPNPPVRNRRSRQPQ